MKAWWAIWVCLQKHVSPPDVYVLILRPSCTPQADHHLLLVCWLLHDIQIVICDLIQHHAIKTRS